MATTVTQPAQVLKMTEVAKVLITPVVDDDGTPTRAIRVWGSFGLTGPAVIELILSAEDEDSLRVTTPELEF